MAKLLTWKEARKIGTSMCEEYGLPAPKLTELTHSYSDRYDVKVKIRRWSPGIFGPSPVEEASFDSNNLEDALAKLQKELDYKYKARAKIAETLRNTYAMQEADTLLDKELRK